jgi:uncharacterized protein YraI
MLQSLIIQLLRRFPVIFVALAGAASGTVAFGQPSCSHPHGNYVVVDVKWEDPIGGLAVRTGPNAGEKREGVIPTDGTGIGVEVEKCTQSGWCPVRYKCYSGWSLLAKYLAIRERRLQRVVNVSASDPDGLNVRSGPHHTYPVKAHISYRSTDLIKHICEPSPVDGSEWCLVTQNEKSGWVSGKYLAPSEASIPPPTTACSSWSVWFSWPVWSTLEIVHNVS